MKTGRNEPCWCGSGIKFKKCHLRRVEETPVEPGHVLAQMRPHMQAKTCLHPDAPAGCRRVIGAHTLQRKRTIESLMDKENKVRTFFPMGLRPGIKNIGWRMASIFYGFCERHDKIFAPVENEPFSGNAEQCFLLGYRAICHEFYKKTNAIAAAPILARNLDKGFAQGDQYNMQKNLQVAQLGRNKGLEDIAYMKDKYDLGLVSRDYDTNFSRCVIRFQGNLVIASTGVLQVDFDMAGNRLQNLKNSNVRCEGIAFGIVATPEGGAFAFSWLRSERALAAFIESLLNYPRQQVLNILVQFVFAYVENTYFSGSWWDGLLPRQRTHLTALAANPIQYGSPVAYVHERLISCSDVAVMCG